VSKYQQKCAKILSFRQKNTNLALKISIGLTAGTIKGAKLYKAPCEKMVNTNTKPHHLIANIVYRKLIVCVDVARGSLAALVVVRFVLYYLYRSCNKSACFWQEQWSEPKGSSARIEGKQLISELGRWISQLIFNNLGFQGYNYTNFFRFLDKLFFDPFFCNMADILTSRIMCTILTLTTHFNC